MLTYKTDFPLAMRALLFVFSLVPLWGSWDLLTGVTFTNYFSPFFLFILIMALGAFSVFLGFFCGAVFGITQTVTVDPAGKKVVRLWRNIRPRRNREELPFAYVRDIEVVTQSWSDGPDDYLLRLHPTAGDSFEIVKYARRRQAVAEAAKLRMMIGLPPA